MINTTLEIPYNLKEKQVNRVTLLRRRFSEYQLDISIEENGRLRGWITTTETTEVTLKGLPAYLNLKRAIQLLNQSYLKFQKEAIEVLPKGLGGGPKQSRPSSALESNKEETCKKEALQLVEIILDDEERRVVREAVEGLLENNPEKKGLNLSKKQIGVVGAQALGVVLQVNQSLQSLNLGSNKIGDVGAYALVAALQTNQTLQSLNLEYNRIASAGAQALKAALQVNQSIQSLNLHGNQLRNGGAQALGTALQVNQSLQILDLSFNDIGVVGAQALGTALQVNQSIQVLNLEWNKIGNAGAQALKTALQVNQSIQSLNLGWNNIGDAGTQALGTALQVNQSIQVLDLGSNQIGDPGAQALGAALQVNQSIQELHISDNQIGKTGAQALGAALQVNQSIQMLYLWTNKIGDVGAQALGAALQVNQSIQVLHISDNEIGDAGAQALGATLQGNQSIQVLNLSSNNIGDVGAQALSAALQVNQSIRSLYLRNNQIGTNGLQALETALQVNDTLQALIINPNNTDAKETIIEKRIETLLRANKRMAILFQQQITQVQSFLQSHKNTDSILLEHLPRLKELLSKWYSDSNNLIPSLEKILIRSGRMKLNDRYKDKLKEIITDLTNRLYELWLELFERKVAALSNEYVMGKESSKTRNIDLGYALYEAWLTFVGSDCPNWLEDHLQSLLPFGVLLDIAEGGEKKDVSDLTNARSLFERVLSFNNESRDSLFSLTNQPQKL